MKKLYEAWPGRNRFLPCGCIFGPIGDSCANLYVYSLFIGVLISYCIFVLPDVWVISPAIPLLFLLIVCVTLVFLQLTQCTDPGFIPRRPFLESDPTKFN